MLRDRRVARSASASERGQVLTVTAIVMALLIAFAGVAIDVGRQLAERRSLQNVVDAAALAACDALIDGSSNGNAEAAARQVATTNLAYAPIGASRNLAGSGQSSYAPGHAGDPSYLTSGILITNDGTVRVAVSASVPTVLARVMGVTEIKTGARAMCQTVGRPEIPILARRYVHAPGPLGGFIDHMATNATSKQGRVDQASILGYDTRTPASRTAPGPVFVLYGPQSKASNVSWFHGYVAFDIRNYTDDATRVYFNGVPSGSHPNQIKNSQSTYITTGYPGPGFPPVHPSQPVANNQVGVIGGLSTAQTVVPFDSVYNVGDEVMLAVYDGTVMEIRDFSIVPPDKIDVPANGTQGGGANFLVTRDPNFTNSVTLSLRGDYNASNPAYNIVNEPDYRAVPGNNTKKMSMRFDPVTFVVAARGTRVQMKDFVTKSIPVGIYTVWIEATSGSGTSYKFHRYSVPVRVGGAVRDFNFGESVFAGDTAASGGTISLPLELVTTNDSAGWGGGAVSLSVDTASLPAGLPASQVTFSASSVTPSTAGTASTLNINTTGLGPGIYTMHLRATGTNGANQPVTHVEELTIGIGISTGDKQYVDIIGFGIFKVTDMKANSISVQAVTGVYGSSDDPALKPRQKARLIPWQ